MNQDLITIGKRAQIAANKLALMNTATKNKALLQLADDLIKNKNQIIAANQQDLAAATQMPTKFTDRLMVNSQRIADMANGLRTIADLNDPTSQIDKGWITKDGLQILQRRVPLGVIGIIFEARPNVTVDATGLTFKSGNAVILRGGKEAIQTNTALVKILRESLQSQHLPVDAVQLITDTSHAIADEMMNLTDYIDVLIPRGGRALIHRVVTHQQKSTGGYMIGKATGKEGGCLHIHGHGSGGEQVFLKLVIVLPHTPVGGVHGSSPIIHAQVTDTTGHCSL